MIWYLMTSSYDRFLGTTTTCRRGRRVGPTRCSRARKPTSPDWQKHSCGSQGVRPWIWWGHPDKSWLKIWVSPKIFTTLAGLSRCKFHQVVHLQEYHILHSKKPVRFVKASRCPHGWPLWQAHQDAKEENAPKAAKWKCAFWALNVICLRH